METGSGGKTIFIWDSEDQYPEQCSNQLLILWQGVNETLIENIISLPAIVEREAEVLRREYLKWVDELSEHTIGGQSITERLAVRENLSAWWLTLIDQKCVYYQSPHIVDVVKLIALSRFVLPDKEIAKIKVVSKNKNLINSLYLWGVKNRVQFISAGAERKTNRSFNLNWVFSPVKALAWISLQYIKRSRLNNIKLIARRPGHCGTIFFSFLPSDLSLHAKTDKYWSPLLDFVKTKRADVRIVFVYSGPFSRADCRRINEFINCLNRDSPFHTYEALSSYLTLNVFVKTVYDWFWLWTRSGKGAFITEIPTLAGFDIKTFLEVDWNESFHGHASLQNILDLNLMERCLRDQSKGTLGFYLAEGQAWEQTLISTWRRLGLGKINGYAHSTVRFWDLRYFHSYNSASRHGQLARPTPDRIIVNGKLAIRNYFNEGATPKLIECEATRYLYLQAPNIDVSSCTEFKVASRPTAPDREVKDYFVNYSLYESTSGRPNRVLVLLDYTRHHSLRLLGLLSKIKIHHKQEIIFNVRMHPEASFDICLPSELRFIDRQVPLRSLFDDHDLVICSAVSSAALECYIYGKPLLVFFDPAGFNLSSVRGLSGVTFFSTVEHLVSHLVDINLLKPPRVNARCFFNIDSSLPLWKRLLTTDWYSLERS